MGGKGGRGTVNKKGEVSLYNYIFARILVEPKSFGGFFSLPEVNQRPYNYSLTVRFTTFIGALVYTVHLKGKVGVLKGMVPCFLFLL